MKTLSLVVSGALALSAAACATGPAYHPLKGGVGYSDTQLQQNQFQVSFAGDSSTPVAKVDQYLLYRAAQLTVADGYDYFVVANQDTDKSTEYQTWGLGQRWIGPGWYHRGWNAWWGMNPVLNDVTTTPSNRFNATATILMRKGPAPSQANTYDAQQLIARLSPQIAVASGS